MLVALELCSAETLDYFRRALLLSPVKAEPGVLFERSMLLGLVWTLYALPLLHHGLRKLRLAPLILALAVLFSATPLLIFEGWRFTPIASFVPVLNLRVVAFCLLAGGWFLLGRWLRRYGAAHLWLALLLVPAQVLAILLGFELLSAEVSDYFRHALALRQGSDAGLRDMRQLALSLSWLLYSLLLLGWGIWRRGVVTRLMAIGLCGLTICKIFSYDLAALPTSYRIISFGGLGLILLSISYLYQRCKPLIADSAHAQL